MPDLSYLPQIALSGIAVGCIYGMIGIGFCVIYNASGIVNFAQGAFVMMGGMIAYSALTAFGLPLLLAAAALSLDGSVGIHVRDAAVVQRDEFPERVESRRAGRTRIRVGEITHMRFIDVDELAVARVDHLAAADRAVRADRLRDLVRGCRPGPQPGGRLALGG